MEYEQASVGAEKIVSDYGSMVSAICRRMLQNEEDAKDAAQEAWTEIIAGLGSFRGEANISTWVYSVAYRSVMRYSQKERLHSIRFLRNYFHGEPLDVPCDIDYDREIWIKEMCDKCLTGILHCLDAESRIAYLFRDLVQLSYEGIGEILGKEPAAVRQAVARSRRKLKNFLEDECILYNPAGKCKCRMGRLVTDINLPQEYQKLRKFINRANFFLETQQVLPQKNYWEYLHYSVTNNGEPSLIQMKGQ